MSDGTDPYTPRPLGGVADATGSRTGTMEGPAFVSFGRPGAGPAPVPSSGNQGTGMAAEWPLRDFIEFGALNGAVPCARLHARLVLWEWGQARLTESVELLVSELMTNAVTASKFAGFVLPVRLWLLSDKTRVLVLIWDANPQPPVRVDSGDEAESGRGLMLVEAISGRWGSYATPELGGKVVWAECEM